MQAVTVSFVQTEKDLVDLFKHASRAGRLGLLVHLTPLAIAILVAIVGWPSAKALGPDWVFMPVGIGMLLLAGARYLGPRIAAFRTLMVWEFNSQHIGETTVSIAPDGIVWSPPGHDVMLPWGIVRRVETARAGIFITAGSPSTAFWVPARCFPSRDDLETVGNLARHYAADTTPVPSSEVQWPLSVQQRKGAVIFAVVWGGPFLLVILLLWFVAHTA